MKDIRVASTLILVAGSELANAPPKLITIKRSSDSNYLPETLVFPGGNFDAGDEHVDWLSIIPSEEQDVHSNIGILSVTPILRALSLRITAIRETFEECGILLCKAYNHPKTDKVTPLFINDINGWRNKIRKNSYEFLNLCRSYRCYPDVKNLYLISTWITPPNYARRYDCKFFVAVMDHVVDGDVDTIEVQSMEWQLFSNCNKNKQIFIPPAQLYEISRLEKFQSINSLLEFVKYLDSKECESIMSVHVSTTDGHVLLLPGDEKYDQFHTKNNHFVEVDGDVLSIRSKIMNRIEYQPTYHPALQRNVVIQNYPPLTPEISFTSMKTKL